MGKPSSEEIISRHDLLNFILVNKPGLGRRGGEGKCEREGEAKEWERETDVLSLVRRVCPREALSQGCHGYQTPGLTLDGLAVPWMARSLLMAAAMIHEGRRFQAALTTERSVTLWIGV